MKKLSHHNNSLAPNTKKHDMPEFRNRESELYHIPSLIVWTKAN